MLTQLLEFVGLITFLGCFVSILAVFVLAPQVAYYLIKAVIKDGARPDLSIHVPNKTAHLYKISLISFSICLLLSMIIGIILGVLGAETVAISPHAP